MSGGDRRDQTSIDRTSYDNYMQASGGDPAFLQGAAAPPDRVLCAFLGFILTQEHRLCRGGPARSNKNGDRVMRKDLYTATPGSGPLT